MFTDYKDKGKLIKSSKKSELRHIPSQDMGSGLKSSLINKTIIPDLQHKIKSCMIATGIGLTSTVIQDIIQSNVLLVSVLYLI
jgi:hypothetical protein